MSLKLSYYSVSIRFLVLYDLRDGSQTKDVKAVWSLRTLQTHIRRVPPDFRLTRHDDQAAC